MNCKRTDQPRRFRRMKILVGLGMLVVAGGAYGQSAGTALPSAPMPQISSPSGDTSASPTPTPLSVKDAQALALKNNPQISVARLTALASQQVTREARSSLWPTARIDVTAVDTNPGDRITAGALNNPVIYQRAAAGATVTQ